jgi:hypothetical protein
VTASPSPAAVGVADIIRRFARSYLAAHGAGMPASHRRAIADILACRTEALGGHVWCCDRCRREVFSYHSCRNRACPRCHADQTAQWLAARQTEMLPTHYFHVTVTVPQQLRALLRANQRDGYRMLMKAAARAIIELCAEPRFVGATVGVLAVLHTWTQQLAYHPHVHCLVTGGGVSTDGQSWHPARHTFLVPHSVLAKRVRANFKAWLASERPDLIVPDVVWTTPWVVHITRWGQGQDAVLNYLARYVFRIAVTDSRIVAVDQHGVTIRYKERDKACWRTCRMDGHEFMRRFLQHVLPKGLHKVRYFGLWHPSKRQRAAAARLLLELQNATPRLHPSDSQAADPPIAHPVEPRRCPHCRQGRLVYIGRLTPRSALGP